MRVTVTITTNVSIEMGNCPPDGQVSADLREKITNFVHRLRQGIGAEFEESKYKEEKKAELSGRRKEVVPIKVPRSDSPSLYRSLSCDGAHMVRSSTTELSNRQNWLEKKSSDVSKQVQVRIEGRENCSRSQLAAFYMVNE